MHSSWDLIRDGLEEVRKHSVDGWIAEDVYHALKSQVSTLHIGYIDSEYAGFCVLTPMQHYSEKKLHVWCTYSTGEHDVLKAFASELDGMARAIGARKITFSSPRAWERRIKEYGFKPMSTNYEREL